MGTQYFNSFIYPRALFFVTPIAFLVFFRFKPFSGLFSAVALASIALVNSLVWIVQDWSLWKRLLVCALSLLSVVPLVLFLRPDATGSFSLLASYLVLLCSTHSVLAAVLFVEKWLKQLYLAQWAVTGYIAGLALLFKANSLAFQRASSQFTGLAGEMLFWSPLFSVVACAHGMTTRWTKTHTIVSLIGLAQAGGALIETGTRIRMPWLSGVGLILATPFFLTLVWYVSHSVYRFFQD